MHKTTELRQQRARLISEIKSIQSAATNGVFSSDQLTRTHQLEAEADRLAESIAINERQDRREKELAVRSGERIAGPNVHDDVASYSLTRAMRIASEGRALDGLEREVHDELQRGMPQAARGILIPLGLESRAGLSVTGGTSGNEGGLMVATQKGQIIDFLRPNLAVQSLGATILTGLTGDLDLPRIDAATNATWKAETAALSASNPTASQLSLRPRRVGTYTEISRQLLVQSSPDIERWLRTDLGNAVAGAWEAAAIAGTGADNQPRGILNTVGIGDVAGGTNGLAPTWAKIVELESKVADADAAQGSLGYLTNTKVRGKLLTTLRNAAGTDATYIWPDDGRVRGYNTGVSNHVPSNLTKGTASGVCSAVLFGNFSDLVLAQWGPGLDLLVNPYAKDTEGLVRISVSAFVDVGVRRAASFAAMKDALTA